MSRATCVLLFYFCNRTVNSLSCFCKWFSDFVPVVAFHFFLQVLVLL
jgi:hypothetical protein